MVDCLVETVACSESDCIVAQELGVDRVELCVAIEQGGLTPSVGLLKEVLANCRLPVMAMIRPRSGHFQYSEIEVRTMERDIEAFAAAGTHGVVFGALDENSAIDRAAMKRLLKAANGLETVFHRAFDAIPSPDDAARALRDLGLTRIMTSGNAASALEGKDVLRGLAKVEGIEILAGGGIRPGGVRPLLDQTGLTQIHLGSFKRVGEGNGKYGDGYLVLDPDEVKAIVLEAKGSTG